MTAFRIFLTVILIAILQTCGIVVKAAQDHAAPPRTLLVSNHLKIQKYTEIVPGMSVIKTRAPGGIELIAIRVKQNNFQFGLVKQRNDWGNWVEDTGKQEKAVVAFNGGFFSINKEIRRIPVGLLKINNVEYSSAWKKSGGYLVFRAGGLAILPTAGNAIPRDPFVLQSKPTLIEPGGKWAMNTNRAIPKKRTLVCIDDNGDTIVLAIVSGGLSLYEAGWLMRGEDVGGYFNCDSALAMDGGGSTQIWVKDRPDLSYTGETPVHNAIIIRPRLSE